MIENRLVVLAVIDLDKCRESCTALSENAGFLDHLKVGALSDLNVIFRLFIVRLDDDSVISYLNDLTGNAGVNINTKTCRSSDELTSLYLVAYSNNRSTRLAYSTLLKQHLNVFHNTNLL